MPLVTEWDIWVRSTDMDYDGIVNNARYFEYFEQARLEHMVRLGVIPSQAGSGATGQRPFTLAETSCRFRAPLRHRDWVRVRCWTTEVRTRSFLFAYEIVLRATGALAAEGASAQVWLDPEGNPAPLPPELRASLEASL